eukprot:GDKI01043122.1.p1 GENE.GDKI01043122.1~~GDKI01043122.1.p1  ORF type:complete len:249 (-),score=70.84 GDKI01043122.1:12-758(-)
MPYSSSHTATMTSVSSNTGGSSSSGKQKTQQDLPDADLKIILLGDSAVGKSKLVERFLLDDYNPRQLSTYALTLFRYNAELEGKKYSIDFWDTAGQEQFDNLHPSYYYQADACILVFDVTRKLTYKNLERWYGELRSYCPDIPCLLVANKIDEDLKVTKKKFNFATTHQLPLVFVSASDGTNVVRMFTEACQLALHNKLNPKDEVMAEIMNLLKQDLSLPQNGGEPDLLNELDQPDHDSHTHTHTKSY